METVDSTEHARPEGTSGKAQHGAPDSSDPCINDAYKKISLLQELYVEFFGTFIPGFVLLVTSGILLAVFVITFFDQHPWTSINSDKTWNLHWYVAVFIIILSYVVGAILYRTEPNRPDKLASYKQWARCNPKDREKLAVQYPEPRNALDRFFKSLLFFVFRTGFIDRQKVDNCFPYPNLREYLIRRGLTHLIKYVPWCAKNGTLEHRTKVVINILKTRIRATYVYPIIQDIVRNEGHIRLMTSIWHVALYLRRFAFCFLALSIAWGSYLYKHRSDADVHVPQQTSFSAKEAQISTTQTPDGLNLSLRFVPNDVTDNAAGAVALNPRFESLYAFLIENVRLKQFSQVNPSWLFVIYFVVVISSTLSKGAIEKSIHYVRNREVVMILESANTIERMGGVYNYLFADFDKRNDDFIAMCNEEVCKNCTSSPKGWQGPPVYNICTGTAPAANPTSTPLPPSTPPPN